MILVLFGQPHSGKTTLASLIATLEHELPKESDKKYRVDGDELREIFKNKSYDKEGRLANLQNASNIAHFLNQTEMCLVVVSMVFPYKEARDYLRDLTDNVRFVYLSYQKPRGREKYHSDDFDLPNDEEVLSLNTDTLDTKQCLDKIINYITEKNEAILD